ncbi:MAG: ATP-binding protein [Blastocatellia bacterium]|nr:ATP-binding protein [Blastocatellia bacterium]
MNAIEGKFTLTVPSSTQNLALIRDFIGTLIMQTGLDENEVLKLTLAVDEACTNVIEHAYGKDNSKEVLVRTFLDNHEIRFEIEDTGLGFDPNAYQPDELERLVAERKSGGLGLRLIQTIMDEVRYEFEPGRKNSLLLIKRLRKDENREVIKN